MTNGHFVALNVGGNTTSRPEIRFRLDSKGGRFADEKFGLAGGFDPRPDPLP